MSELAGSVGESISLQITAVDSLGSPITYSALNLPPGLSMNASSGVVSGTPSQNGNWLTTIAAKSSTSVDASEVAFTWLIGPAGPPAYVLLTVTMSPMSNDAGVPVEDVAINVEGGLAPYTFEATGLPTGLDADASTGSISGTPTSIGSFAPTATVTDATGASSSGNWTWDIPGSLLYVPHVPGVD